MKLKVTQENLSKALNYVARVASNRSTLPILSNVLLQVENNQLSITATNLDIAIKSQIGAQVQQEGSLTVPAKLLQDLISSLPSGVIELNKDEQRLKITTSHYKSIINGVSPEEFPVMPETTNGKTFELDAQTLKHGLQQVLVAASNDDSRPVLTGVFLQTIDGVLYGASTDSYRLAERSFGKHKNETNLLVPASALHDVVRIIGDSAENVVVTHDDQQVRFEVDDVSLVARLIDGKYPDYRKLIPSSFETSATLSRTELLNIVKIAGLFARESAGSVVLSIDDTDNQLSVQSVASQLGENNATAEATASGSGQITLNSRYLLEALQTMSSDDITVAFNGKLDPVLLSDPKSNNYLHIIMPLKS